ncbi:hypothetical protein BJX65DRAFT_304935 [Aspergillus insuetus]
MPGASPLTSTYPLASMNYWVIGLCSSPHQIKTQMPTPEPLKEFHDDSREIVVAIKQAKSAGNTELKTELAARHREPFQKCREEARKLIEEAKSRINPDAPRIPIPDAAKAIEAELNETAKAYNAAIQASDHPFATEFREASASAAASASASGPHNTSLAIDGVRI